MKTRVPRGPWRAIAVGSLFVVGAASTARAAEPSPGTAVLEKARAAWDKGALQTAEALYREAIEKGGLGPAEVLEGYVRLGAVRASRGKRDQAVAAFRAAAILDSDFKVPRQAGSKGPSLAKRAKHDTEKIGSIVLSLTAPNEIKAGKPFMVSANLDKAHVPIVAKIAFFARDGTSGKETSVEGVTAEQVDVEIPGDVALPDASLLVRVDALDAHSNRLASAEERVRVVDDGAVAAAPVGASSASTSAIETRPRPRGDTGVRTGGSFWSSPWPYVIGSVALAGAGAAVYFGTRPPDDVSVGQVGVQTR